MKLYQVIKGKWKWEGVGELRVLEIGPYRAMLSVGGTDIYYYTIRKDGQSTAQGTCYQTLQNAQATIEATIKRIHY